MFTLLWSSAFNRWFCYLLTSISHSGFSKLPILFMQIYIIEDPQLQQIFFRDASSTPSTTTNGCRYVVAWPSTDLEILKPPMVILDGVTSAMNLGQLLGCRFFGESAVFLWWGEACMGRSSCSIDFFVKKLRGLYKSRCHEVLRQKESFCWHVLLGGWGLIDVEDAGKHLDDSCIFSMRNLHV